MMKAFILALLLGVGFLPASGSKAAPSPRQLLEVQDLSSPALSPDGRFVAFRQEAASVERNTYGSAWYVLALDSPGAPTRVSDGGAPLRYDFGGVVSSPPIWSPDGRWIFYRAEFDGAVQIWRARTDGSLVERISADPANVETFALSPDGCELVYAVGAARAEIEAAETAEYDRGIRIDPTIAIGQGLFQSADIDGRLASVRMAGDWSDRGGLLARTPRRWKIVDLARGVTRDASPTDLQRLASVMTDTLHPPDKAGDAIASARSADRGDLAYGIAGGDGPKLWVLRNGKPALAPIACLDRACRNASIAAVAWRPGRDQVAFTTWDRDRGHAQSLRLWDLPSGAVHTIVEASGLLAGGRGSGLNESCAVGSAVAACVAAEADAPPRLERIDLETGTRQVLYAPNRALAATVGPPAQFLRWNDPSGRVFTGDFFPPAGAKTTPAPLFITYYSCSGYLRGGAGDEWPLASLAGAGVGALCINEPPSDPSRFDQLVRYQTALSGVSAAIRMLAAKGLADPSRVGMGGLSFGSEVTLWVAMRSNLLAAASVSSSAVTPTYYLFHGLQPQYRSVIKRLWGLGSPDDTPARWKLISPAFNADKIHAPLLLQMPEQEYLEALDYFMPLANSATPTDLYVFPNEPHQKVQPQHKLAAYERNLDWFRFWLQGYVDPDPRKAAQYDLWQAMRRRAAAAQRSPSAPATSTAGAARHP